MASANVTLAGSSAKDFEADNTQRTATLLKPGGVVTNNSPTNQDIVINVEGATISALTQPLDTGSVLLGVGASWPLPHSCSAFTFKASGSGYLNYSPR